MIDAPAFDFDEVGDWSVLKLDIIEKYGSAYTTAFKNLGRNLKKYYIDGFSGAGEHISKQTGERIDGSPARALRVKPPFDQYYFIDLNHNKAAYLRKQCGNRSNVHVVSSDANVYLRELLPTIQKHDFKRALCVLDPYGLDLDWEIIKLAGKSQTVDMFLNFPVMAMNRAAIWKIPENAPQNGIDRLNKFWGDDSWRQAAYTKSRQSDLFSDPENEKQPNEAIVNAFQERLKEVAGFKYVPEPIPMKNSKNAVVYYLFFAAPVQVADKIINDIYKKYRR